MQAPQVVFVEPGRVEVQMKPVAVAVEPEVLFQARYSTISPGTELAFLQALPNASAVFPNVFGCSACGHIVNPGGPGRAEHSRGDLVVAAVRHAALSSTSPETCHRVPAGLDPVAASAFRLAAISLQGVRKAQVQVGQRVAVLGLGVIGNLAAQLALSAGAAAVTGIDPVPWRGRIACECGISEVFGSADEAAEVHGEAAFDIVIEATGAPEPINQAFGLARRLGRVILLGSTRGVTERVNFYRDVHKKGLHVIGAHASIVAKSEDAGPLCTLATDAVSVLDLMSSGRLRVGPLISDVVPWNEAPSAYQRLLDRKEQLLTIALDWDGAVRLGPR